MRCAGVPQSDSSKTLVELYNEELAELVAKRPADDADLKKDARWHDCRTRLLEGERDAWRRRSACRQRASGVTLRDSGMDGGG